MNWLAHLFLSEPNLDFRLGNLLADFVKGRDLQAMSPGFRRGARCHLTIDGFTDFHPVFLRSRARITARHGHFSGILVDVFYDHFLARNWERFAGGSLDDWIRELHAAIRAYPLALPGDAALAVEHMVETDRLRSYRELAGVADALGRLSRRLVVRLRRPVALERAVEDLVAHHAELESDFLEFFPALREHVAAWRDDRAWASGRFATLPRPAYVYDPSFPMRWQTLYEARWIFAVLLVIAALSSWLISPWLSLLWTLLIGYVFWFFRDPERVVPAGEKTVVAAADGVIVGIEDVEEPEVVKGPMRRVAIFLSVFDVHTNRAPIDGTVTYTERRVGKMLDARHPDATRLNECCVWALHNPAVGTVVVRQITGAIARRIVAWAQVGQQVAKGERFGMIRFGSRTEVYLPMGAEITVKIGDRVQGGASVIARLP